MTDFIALYRGETVASSRILAITADPGIVHDFATRMLDEVLEEEVQDADPVLGYINGGRRQALRVIANEGNKKGPAESNQAPDHDLGDRNVSIPQ